MERKMRRLLLAFGLILVLLGQAAAALPEQLMAVGRAVGIQMELRGVVITGFDPAGSAAEEAGLKTGDVIYAVDHTPTTDAQTLREKVSQCDDGTLAVQAERKGKKLEVLVHPKKAEEGYCLGVYIRDEIAGIGTVTYYDPVSGAYGALGHGVSDQATGQLMPLRVGALLQASVASVVQGRAGAPGQLQGAFQPNQILGSVTANTTCGIFGRLGSAPTGRMVPVAGADEVQTGEAMILSNVAGETTQAFSVEISRVYPTNAEGRNLLLKVTDEQLLARTGGIVQGMSGSPILQNGKLIGAVTHVLVNDPTRGYGIFIENMLDAAAA